MSFLLGCNYWASNAGCEMWNQWDESVVQKDLALLAGHGVSCMRVFPNWRDFQPVEALYGSKGKRFEYRMAGGALPQNQDYLDPVMLARFHRLCQLAEKNGIQLIVGLLTGWMSGRLYTPPALAGLNLFVDPTALLFQQKFIHGFIQDMKAERSILAWDFGNECNCMGEAEHRDQAHNWSLCIGNAIRAADATRPVVSGMHSLEVNGVWTIEDQAEASDILTTHPYPYWVPHTARDRIGEQRTLLHATAESRLYAGVGDRPCLVEEIGTMGPMVCSDEMAAHFLNVNLFSNWANGAEGLLWWCAHEQAHLTTPPYDWNMCERELGLLDSELQPKPALQTMGRFAQFLGNTRLDLPPAQVDGVCILTQDQDTWGCAYSAYLLAKQAGVNISFRHGNQPLPDAPVYLLPSISGPKVMSGERYQALKEKVRQGATLYISVDDGFLTEFAALTGMKVLDSETLPGEFATVFDGEEIRFQRTRKLWLEPAGATVLAEEEGAPVFSVHPYGKGRVYLLAFPLEAMLLDMKATAADGHHRLYRQVFCQSAAHNPLVGTTRHRGCDKEYTVMVNYSGDAQPTGIVNDGLRCLYGSFHEIAPYDACVFEGEVSGK